MTSVSVIIPAYNQGHYLEGCVQSVLNQSYQDFEVIIVDDGSTDRTKEIGTSFSDSRVHYIYQSNKGLSGARNTGIKKARGKYITYLDSDDQFLPKKLEVLVDKLENEPDLGLVAGEAIIIDEQGKKLGEVFDAPPPEDPLQFIMGNPLHVGSILIRAEWQSKVGYFDESLRSYEDWDMWLRLAKAGCQFGWVAQPVSLYRFHRDQMTRNGAQMTTATFKVLEKTYSADLPDDWRKYKDIAYSNAYLRAAPQAYLSRDFNKAKSYINKAIELNPKLQENHAKELATRIAGWADYSKIDNPLAYLTDVYNNLPDSLEDLAKRGNNEIAEKATQLAFTAFENSDYQEAQLALRCGIKHKPHILVNRGILSIYLKSLLKSSSSNKK